MTGTRLEGLEHLHLEMQQTAVDGFLLADGTRNSEQGESFSFEADIGMNPEIFSQVTARQEFVSLPMSRQ